MTTCGQKGGKPAADIRDENMQARWGEGAWGGATERGGMLASGEALLLDVCILELWVAASYYHVRLSLAMSGAAALGAREWE